MINSTARKGKENKMAKVQITAKALLRNGLLTDTAGHRDKVLAVVGKNDKLLKEMQVHGYPLARLVTIDDEQLTVIVEPDKENGRVTVQVVDELATCKGSATFGYTSFFKCVDDSENADD